MSNVKLVIFDIDGTLVNTGVDWTYIKSKLRRELGINFNGRPLAEVLQEVQDADIVNKAISIISEEEKKSVGRVSFDRELADLIMCFKERGIKIAIVTLRSRETAEEIIDRLGISKFVDLLISREEVPNRKQQLVLAINGCLGNKFRENEILFFGDTDNDVLSGREIGIKTIRINNYSGVGVPKELKRKLNEVINQANM